jgi:hypothetical protein
MKLAVFTLSLIAICAALPGARLDNRDYNSATEGVSGPLATKVEFACTLLQQILGTKTLFPGTANYTTENTGI